MEKLLRGDDAVDDGLDLEVQRPRPPGRVAPAARIVRARAPRIFRAATDEARRRDRNGVVRGADVALARAAETTGVPLPLHVRKRFEASLAADLSAVRVH